VQRKSTVFKKSVLAIGVLSVLLFLQLVGCCNKSTSDTQVIPKKIGLMITPRGLNDRGFNDYAHDGLRAAEKKMDVEGIIIEPATMQDQEASLRFFAGQKFDAIIAVGTAFVDTIRKISQENPELVFFIIDSDINEGNIRGISFREDEGAFLCGHLAARVSRTGKIGFIGGVKIPVIERFADGFRYGALNAASSTEVIEQYIAEDFSGFNKPEQASDMAQAMFGAGCDVIFPAAGGSGLGVISAAVKTRSFVIGVDMNQDSLAPGIVLTSMLKRVDLVVENIISDICSGRTASSIKRSYGLIDNAIGLTDFQLSYKVVGEEIIRELASLRKLIIDGKIKTKAVEK